MDRTITSTECRRQFTDALLQVRSGDHIGITHYDRPTAVLVPPDWYERAARLIDDATQNDE